MIEQANSLLANRTFDGRHCDESRDCIIASMKFDPTFVNSKACRSNSFARALQARIRRTLLPFALSFGDYTAIPNCRLTMAKVPPPTPLFAGRPTR